MSFRLAKTNKDRWRTYINPDGSTGGRISEAAVVEESAVVEVGGIVHDAHIYAGEVVHQGELISPDRFRIRFDGRPPEKMPSPT